MIEIILAICLALSIGGNIAQCFFHLEVNVKMETTVNTTVTTEARSTADSYNVNVINNRAAAFAVSMLTNKQGSNFILVLPNIVERVGLTNRQTNSFTNTVTNYTSNYTQIGWR